MQDPKLLVSAPEFVSEVEPAILEARRRVLFQVMTFEMDSVGRYFWDLLARSPAEEKILCVDAFSTVKISDDLVFSPRFLSDPGFRREVRDTRSLLRLGERDGVRIVVTNPMGCMWRKFPFRNHKKMMVVDDQAFLGGINLSEHNFRWHDLMMRTGCPTLVDALARDFHHTLCGVNASRIAPTGLGKLYFLDGRRSRAEYEELFTTIAHAQKSVDVISPYLSDPLLERLTRLPASVRVRVINPARNNKAVMQQTLFRATAGSNLEIFLYQPEMCHVKAVLVDGAQLMLGSCNFDFVAYDLQQEVVLCTDDPGAVRQFRDRVLAPMLAESVRADSTGPSVPPGRLRRATRPVVRRFAESPPALSVHRPRSRNTAPYPVSPKLPRASEQTRGRPGCTTVWRLRRETRPVVRQPCRGHGNESKNPQRKSSGRRADNRSEPGQLFPDRLQRARAWSDAPSGSVVKDVTRSAAWARRRPERRCRTRWR